MKAQELRIGNLIMVENCIQEIVELPLPKNCTQKNTKGITLTEQWIINLGFINLIISEHWIFPLVIEKDNFGWTLRISTANGSIICSSTIDYVHELQNLYFAITKNELVLRK
jgi:hypothetical protein